jgi:hypothetical protein
MGTAQAGARLLAGLPPYGPLAQPIPLQWGRRGSEGVVVEFTARDGERWVGNFQPGMGTLDDVLLHPDGRRVLIVAHGDLWAVDADSRTAELVLHDAFDVWRVEQPPGYIANWCGLAFVRIAAEGLRWQTRRLSWDGFREVVVGEVTLTGSAYTPIERRWEPFAVELSTGASRGGSFGPGDHEGWERLCRIECPLLARR